VTPTYSATYSKYYSGNVAKVNVGITSSGVITFASLAYPGKISDVAIAKTLLDLELLDAGDDIMADKGFTIHHLTYLLGCPLNYNDGCRLLRKKILNSQAKLQTSAFTSSGQ
jgi:hypothetical protein